jgi:hypothetical protein
LVKKLALLKHLHSTGIKIGSLLGASRYAAVSEVVPRNTFFWLWGPIFHATNTANSPRLGYAGVDFFGKQSLGIDY